MKIFQLAIGTCVTDSKMLKDKIPSNDGALQNALTERLLELSDAGESIPKGYEDKSKEEKPRKRASAEISQVMWLRKNPINGMLYLSDSNGHVLSKYDAENPAKAKTDAIQFCKDSGYQLMDETNTPPQQPVRLAQTVDPSDAFGMENLWNSIGPGDTVTIVTPHGQQLKGRAVMRNRTQPFWVLNMGGPHGTPGLASPENTIGVRKARQTKPKPDSNTLASTAAKRYKKRPPSHVGKMEGAYNAPGATNKMDTRLTPAHRYVLETDFPILFKKAGLPLVDENTLLVGKIKSVNDAKRLCVEKYEKVPWPGYEMIVDSGTTKQTDIGGGSEFRQPNVWSGTHDYEYKTYLQNHAGQFRVWTWINVNPGQILNRGR